MRLKKLIQKAILKNGKDQISKYENKYVSREPSLFHYFNMQIESKKAYGREGIAAAYISTQRSLSKFTNISIVQLSDIDYSFVRDYFQSLLVKGISLNTISFYMRNFRAIYNQAVLGRHIPDKNPFQYVKIQMHKTSKRSLNSESLRKIASLDLSDKPKLELSRDIFLFSFYTRGMSFVDIIHLRNSNIENGFIRYTRNKTQQFIQISLIESHIDLINKYKNDSGYIFPILNDESSVSLYLQYKHALRLVNLHLKTIAKMLNLEISLTTYVARHSWATIAKECGTPIAVISEGLGHTSEKTTQIYLKEFDQSVLDKANQSITSSIKLNNKYNV